MKNFIDSLKIPIRESYNWVLHDVHIFLKFEVIVNVNKSLFLSECLKHMMGKIMDCAEKEHSSTVQGCGYCSVYSYTEVAMNFDGIDSDMT